MSINSCLYLLFKISEEYNSEFKVKYKITKMLFLLLFQVQLMSTFKNLASKFATTSRDRARTFLSKKNPIRMIRKSKISVELLLWFGQWKTYVVAYSFGKSKNIPPYLPKSYLTSLFPVSKQAYFFIFVCEAEFSCYFRFFALRWFKLYGCIMLIVHKTDVLKNCF